MRKVGIMSMQRIANYGSFLQAYALKQLIEELSCKVEFVDYHVGAPVITENADSKNKFVRKVEKGLETFQYQAPFAHKLSFIRYKQTFSKKYMPLLGITDEMNYNPTLDCLVIGSDEVFNCIQKNSNVGYSLELFGKDNHAKRLLTYAASFGNTTLEKLEKYKKADEVGVCMGCSLFLIHCITDPQLLSFRYNPFIIISVACVGMIKSKKEFFERNRNEKEYE